MEKDKRPERFRQVIRNQRQIYYQVINRNIIHSEFVKIWGKI